MSRKRGFEEIGGVSLFPAPKRRKMCNGQIDNVQEEKEKEEESIPLINIKNSDCMDTQSIASVVESIDSLESDMEYIDNDKENEEECTDLLCKLQFNPQIIIPFTHFTQTICIFGGNYQHLTSILLSNFTNNLLEIINDYNYKLQLNINTMNNNINNDNKTKLLHTMIAQKLLENQSFNKILYENNLKNITSKYENCDICVVFPDKNINILCQICEFIKTPKKSNNIENNTLNVINQNKELLIGKKAKRILIVNNNGFFNGLRLQIMNFTSNHNDLPNQTNIVFVEHFNLAIKHLKQWSK